MFSGTMQAPEKLQAAKNLVMVGASIYTILRMAKAIDPESVDFDPRSANFGKIKVGDTRFDVTGGAAPFVMLMSRLATQSTKSSVTGIETKLGENYGVDEPMDIFWDFTENKFSPLFGTFKDVVNRETFSGDPITAAYLVKNLTVPIIVEEGVSAFQNQRSAGVAAAVIADGLGISTNTYGLDTNWNTQMSKELEYFKGLVGKETFKEANDLFNKHINDWFAGVRNETWYKKLPSDDKAKLITDKRRAVKKVVFKKYGLLQ